jgi:hypothetical protein
VTAPVASVTVPVASVTTPAASVTVPVASVTAKVSGASDEEDASQSGLSELTDLNISKSRKVTAQVAGSKKVTGKTFDMAQLGKELESVEEGGGLVMYRAIDTVDGAVVGAAVSAVTLYYTYIYCLLYI